MHSETVVLQLCTLCDEISKLCTAAWSWRTPWGILRTDLICTVKTNIKVMTRLYICTWCLGLGLSRSQFQATLKNTYSIGKEQERYGHYRKLYTLSWLHATYRVRGPLVPFCQALTWLQHLYVGLTFTQCHSELIEIFFHSREIYCISKSKRKRAALCMRFACMSTLEFKSRDLCYHLHRQVSRLGFWLIDDRHRLLCRECCCVILLRRSLIFQKCHCQIILCQDVPHFCSENKEALGLCDWHGNSPAIQVHKPQMKPRLCMTLQVRSGN